VQKLGSEERHCWQPVRIGRLTPFFRSDLALLLLLLFAFVAEQFHLAALHLFEVVVFALAQTLQKTGRKLVVVLDVPVVGGGRQRPAVAFDGLLQAGLRLLFFLLGEGFAELDVAQPEVILGVDREPGRNGGFGFEEAREDIVAVFGVERPDPVENEFAVAVRQEFAGEGQKTDPSRRSVVHLTRAGGVAGRQRPVAAGDAPEPVGVSQQEHGDDQDDACRGDQRKMSCEPSSHV
jgi:hypothetical protein